MSERYVSVTATLRKVKPTSIALLPEGGDDLVWVPRSLIHGADERQLDTLEENETVTLRIFEWKAKQEGLI